MGNEMGKVAPVVELVDFGLDSGFESLIEILFAGAILVMTYIGAIQSFRFIMSFLEKSSRTLQPSL